MGINLEKNVETITLVSCANDKITVLQELRISLYCTPVFFVLATTLNI